MIRTILLPVDGSTSSEHALPVALDAARRAGASLHIVHVHDTPLVTTGPEALPVVDVAWDSTLRVQEAEYLRTLAGRCMERAGISPVTEVLDGPVAAALSAYAAEVGVDLIVMTTHGRGGISRAWVGSVADALVRRASVPILLVRPQEKQIDWSRGAAARHILVPLDGSPLSESVLEPALALGALGGARFTLLRVIVPMPFVISGAGIPTFSETGAELTRQQAEVYLEELAERMRARGVDAEWAVVQHSMPAHAVLEYAATYGIDTVAMATHGRGGWSRVALGSVADKVIRGTLIPVLVYRPGVTERDTRTRAAAGERLVEAG